MGKRVCEQAQSELMYPICELEGELREEDGHCEGQRCIGQSLANAGSGPLRKGHVPLGALCHHTQTPQFIHHPMQQARNHPMRPMLLETCLDLEAFARHIPFSPSNTKFQLAQVD